MHLFTNIVNEWKPLTIFTETSILYVWLDFQYNSDISLEIIDESAPSLWQSNSGTIAP